jgi:uncharacterized protein
MNSSSTIEIKKSKILNPDSDKSSKFWSSIDVKNVSVNGEFGRRIEQVIDNNVLKVDVQKAFLDRFQNRAGEGYIGLGKFLDAIIRLAYQSRNAQLIKLKNKIIADLVATQDSDGYIGIVKDESEHIKELWDLHERSYLILAFVSDYHYFDSQDSIAVAQRMGDHIIKGFSKDPSIRPKTLDGLVNFDSSNLGCDCAMLALSEASGDRRYREFAIAFLKVTEFNPKIECGPTSLQNHTYAQLSHCLAQLSLYQKTQEESLLTASLRAVDFMRKEDGMLITGSCSESECWHQTQSGLQNTAETCVGFYVIQLMDSLLRIKKESLYGDILERTVYNAMLAAISPDGRRSRYFTPFEGKRLYDTHGDSFCCPNNFRRFLSRLSGLIYYSTGDGIVINLYNSSTARVELSCGTLLTLEQETSYPSFGLVRIKVNPAKPSKFVLHLRIPRWCKSARIVINGQEYSTPCGGAFYSIGRTWNNGDVVELDMPMEWRFVRGRKSQIGRVALMRGPLIFTLNPTRTPELSTHPEFEPRQIMIDPSVSIETDSNLRPDGVAGIVQSWPAGHDHFWKYWKKVSTTLSEFHDPDGQGIYFIVPDLTSDKLVDDELMICHPYCQSY